MSAHATHKRHVGTRPSADCLACWLAWMDEKPTATIVARDMRRIIGQAMHASLRGWQTEEMWKRHIQRERP